jgi:PKD repeat protein
MLVEDSSLIERPMKHYPGTLATIIALLLMVPAFGQPLPPYTVQVTGMVAGCNPGLLPFVTVATSPGTLPQTDVDVPLDSICAFSVNLTMTSPQGSFVISFPCNGAIQTQTVSYAITNSDTVAVTVLLNCNSLEPDCEGTLGGSALPGTACDDGDPNTYFDTWSPGCQCFGGTDPNNFITVIGTLDGCSGAGTPVQIITLAAPGYQDTVFTDANCSYTYTFYSFASTGQVEVNASCDGGATQIVESGNWTSGPSTVTIDLSCTPTCNACFTFDQGLDPITGDTIPWTINFTNCSSSSSLPVTYVWDFGQGEVSSQTNPSLTLVSEGLYVICLTISDSNGCMNTFCDSLQVDGDGWLVPVNSTTCQAGFWVVQAYDIVEDGDSSVVEPVPNEVWVWNLSSGGDGNYQFFWSFGDGTSSTEAYPTHVYATGGPYQLCLTMTDGSGCTNSYCDEVSVDEDGLYTGLIVDGRPTLLRSGFTIRVVSEQPTAIIEREWVENVALWPNPVEDVIGLSFNSLNHASLSLTIFDLNGRVVHSANTVVNTGQNNHRIHVADLEAGMYLLQIANGNQHTSRRFVKR